MASVIKRGGRKQAFSANKIRKSIQRAAKDAKIPGSKMKQLVKEVAEPVIKLYKNKNVRAVKLRKVLLDRLSRRNKKVVSSWRRFEKKKKR